MRQETENKIIGANLRRFRAEAGLSQGQLAGMVKEKITFQQVQKYENGTNRVSAAQLWEFGKLMGRPVTDFFEGLDQYEMFEPDLRLPNKAAILMARIHCPQARQLAMTMLTTMSKMYNKVEERKAA